MDAINYTPKIDLKNSPPDLSSVAYSLVMLAPLSEDSEKDRNAVNKRVTYLLEGDSRRDTTKLYGEMAHFMDRFQTLTNGISIQG